MRKKGIVLLSTLLLAFSFHPTSSFASNDFEGNEEEWLKTCSVAQKTQAEVDKCREFKSYYQSKKKALSGEVASLEKEVLSVKGDIKKLRKAIETQEKLIIEIEGRIEANKQNIKKINAEIKLLDDSIKKIQIDIDARDALIRKRMQDDQSYIGTNMVVEVIMGSSDLMDMIRRIDGLNRIDEQDRNDIKAMLADIEKQLFQKKEQERLKSEQEDMLAQNIEQEKNAESVKKQKEILLDEFREQEERLNEEMRSVKVDMSTIEGNMIQIKPELAQQQITNNNHGGSAKPGNTSFSGNGVLARPVNGSVSAHSFHYPNGSIHMGLDVAVPLMTPIHAPGNGIILFAANPCATNSGYIGNRTGYPAGTGNSIHMLTRVKKTTYALSFFHMAQENFNVRAGDIVSTGDVLGLSGNTGNTSGPHCHLEVFNLGNMSIEEAVRRFQATADFAWGNGWYATGLTNICDVRGPICREHPEKVYGY